jgi:hypothetical protein
MIIQIDCKYGCFGLIAKEGKIVEAAPIAKWTLGKSAKYVLYYFRRKGCDVSLHIENEIMSSKPS